MRPVLRGDEPTHITSSGREQPSASEEYGFFMGELIKRLGEYCSYCEVPLGANLAIEHKKPKSIYPNAEIDWNNFLLACTNCNSRKGKKIPRADLYWPDDTTINLADRGFNTYTMLEYYVGQVDTENVVLVRPKEGTPADRTIVEALIDMVGLKNYNPADDDDKMSDRRVWNRTQTWATAVLMANTLSGYYARYNDTGDDVTAAADFAIKALKRQIIMAAQAAGFWSVWVTVFSNNGTFINDAGRNALIEELFFRTFPGTRYP